MHVCGKWSHLSAYSWPVSVVTSLCSVKSDLLPTSMMTASISTADSSIKSQSVVSKPLCKLLRVSELCERNHTPSLELKQWQCPEAESKMH